MPEKEIFDNRVNGSLEIPRNEDYWKNIISQLKEKEPELLFRKGDLKLEKTTDELKEEFTTEDTGLEIGETGDPIIDYYAGKLLRSYWSEYKDIQYNRNTTKIKPLLRNWRGHIKQEIKNFDKKKWEQIYDEFNYLLDKKVHWALACR